MSVVAVDPAGNVSAPTAVTVLDRKLVLSNALSGPGSVQTVSGTGWMPGETVTVTLCSACQVVGTPTVDGNGRFSVTFTVPAGTPVGVHTVTGSGSVSSKGLGDVSVSFTVVVAAPAGGSVGGAASGLGGVVALLLVAGSAGVLVVRRRRDEVTL